MRNTRNMKAFKVILTACMAVGLLTIYAADTDGIYVWKNGSYTHFDEEDIVFSDTLINIADTKFSVNDIDSITFVQPAEVATVTDTVCIVYDGQTATVSPASVEGITAEVDGATVTLTNENTDRELGYQWTKDMLTVFNEFNIAWTTWCYDADFGFWDQQHDCYKDKPLVDLLTGK